MMQIGSVEKKKKKKWAWGGKTDHKFHHASCGTKEPLKLELVQVYDDDDDDDVFIKFCQSLKTTNTFRIANCMGEIICFLF